MTTTTKQLRRVTTTIVNALYDRRSLLTPLRSSGVSAVKAWAKGTVIVHVVNHHEDGGKEEEFWVQGRAKASVYSISDSLSDSQFVDEPRREAFRAMLSQLITHTEPTQPKNWTELAQLKGASAYDMGTDLLDRLIEEGAVDMAVLYLTANKMIKELEEA